MKQIYKRNELGLLDGVEYQYYEDGSINWRAMVKEEHLYPNKGWFEKFNKPVPKTVKGLGDYQLLIKLSGIKELAKLRGFTTVKHEIFKCDLEHVAVKCGITWTPNYESYGQEIYFEDIGNATVYNTGGFAKKFLETIAANRAFVRCVRNFLNVHIVGADEVDTSEVDESDANNNEQSTTSSKLKPQNLLMKKLGLGVEDFDTFKDILRGLWKSGKYQNEEVSGWQNWDDIPKKERAKLLEIL